MNVVKTQSTQPYPELRGAFDSLRYPVIGEVKYDGEYNVLKYWKGSAAITNKYGKTRSHFPALDRIISQLKGVKSAGFLCELYYGDGKNGCLYDLLSHKESDDLNIYVFDVVEVNGDSVMLEQLIARKEFLSLMMPNETRDLRLIENKDMAKTFFKSKVSEGYEGVVLKPLDGHLVFGPINWVKMKYKDTSRFPITLIDPVKERVEVYVPIAGRKYISKNGIQFHGVNVGVKVPNKVKMTLNVGDFITVEHQGKLASGSLRHPVFKGAQRKE